MHQVLKMPPLRKTPMATTPVRKKTPKKKLSIKQAAAQITALIEEHLAQFPEEERNERVRRFAKRVDEAARRAKS
jgi:hypothetical protein